MRNAIYDIYDLEGNKICSTINKDEIKYYKNLGYRIVKTGSFVIVKF